MRSPLLATSLTDSGAGEHPGFVPMINRNEQEFAMSSKNKGGREIRKPKQAKAPKAELTNVVSSAVTKAVGAKKK